MHAEPSARLQGLCKSGPGEKPGGFCAAQVKVGQEGVEGDVDSVPALHWEPCRFVQHQQLRVRVQDAPLNVLRQLRLQLPYALWHNLWPVAACSGNPYSYIWINETA